MDRTRVTTPRFRASYVFVWEPRAADEDQEPRYGISMLFTKDTNLKPMKNAALAAAKRRWGEKAIAMIENGSLRMPFRDGDTERAGDPNYRNMVFVNANSKKRPGVVNENVEDILDPKEFYSGCWARATINFFAYDVKGNRGVGVGLNNLQKMGDGERLDGTVNAVDDFDPVDVPGLETAEDDIF